MNKILITFLLLVTVAFSFAQVLKSRVYIQENDRSYDGKRYFFSAVIDKRPDQNNIGIIYHDDRKTAYAAVLKHALNEELNHFLKHVFLYAPSKTRILVVIREFEIGEVLSETDTGVVKINFDFYKIRNDSVAFISNYTKRIAEAVKNRDLWHENRMKRVILYAAADMELHLNTMSGNAFVPASSLGLSTGSRFSGMPEDSLRKKNYPAYSFIMLGGHAAFCSSTQAFGVNLSALFRLRKDPKWLMGFSANYSLIRFYDAQSVLPANSSYKLHYADFDFRVLRQIWNPFFFDFGAHLLAGVETLNTAVYNSALSLVTDKSDQNFFRGFQFDFGIYLIPPRKKGPFVGMDFIIRATSSDIFDNDAGILLSTGFKF